MFRRVRSAVVVLVAALLSAVMVAPAGATSIPAPLWDAQSFRGEILAMYNAGVVTGYEDGRFRPLEHVSRAAAATWVYRANPDTEWEAGQTCSDRGLTSPFSDVADDHPFCVPIVSMVQAGMITGYADGTFRPNEPVTRGAFAAFMFDRNETVTNDAPFRDVPPGSPLDKSINAAHKYGITTGYADGTFRPGGLITREAAAAMVYRYYHHLRG